ncbi:MAG: DegT/DnrJ/EryC1/StrS family aminotransferase, partial [Anaerolineae bacterium]|nr:DegT/DnrJ/EryC1/StrS family aminotransferase [Anaerolineae bacterium]
MIRKYRPYLDLSDILAALRPGTGRNEFESAVAARVGARYAVAFAYGHSGAIASLKALGVTEAEVILPAYTCTVMADSVVASGNRPVFVDIDLADYNMGLDAMKATLTLQTRAIVATHMYGYPTNVDAIREAVGDERVLIIEDRALGLLTSTLGTTDLRGDIGLFSFGPNKHLFTVQGGVIATNSIDLYEKIKACRDREMDHLPAAVWIKRWMRLLFSYLPFGDSISLHGLLNKIQNTTAPNRSPSHFNPTPTLV